MASAMVKSSLLSRSGPPRSTEYLAQKERTDDCLFPAIRHRLAYFSGDFTKILEAAKIDPQGATVTFHAWRHTFITAMATAGVPRELRMRIAGHTQEQTHDGYDHDVTRIRDAIERLA